MFLSGYPRRAGQEEKPGRVERIQAVAARPDPAWNLTALNSASGTSTLQKSLGWWLLGFPIAVGYLVLLFRIHRGTVQPEGEGY